MSPYPNEHACRLEDPAKVKVVGSITKEHNGKKFRILVGKKEGSTGTVAQAYRYPRASWSESEARAHCKDHGGSFEAARSAQEMSEEELQNPDNNPLIKTGE